MNIIIIGTGNVATVIGRKIISAGHNIIQVYGRKPANADALAEILQSKPILDLDKLERSADLVLCSVPDDAYAMLLGQIPRLHSLLVHTAGAVPIGLLKKASDHFGVLYPLQTLRKEITTVPEFPLLIDAGEPADLKILRQFATSLSKNVEQADDETRLKYHLGAVLVSNFTNHLFALTENWCKAEDISFSLLQPIIQETVNRIRNVSPADVQTGPAMRNDVQTLEKHKELLCQYPQLSTLYDLFTKSIRQFHQK